MNKILAAFAVVFLASCANTSEGVVLGAKGSPWWNQNAPAADIKAFYDEKRTYELCTIWDKAISQSLIRRHISEALIRRGEPEDRCYDQGRDALALSARAMSRPLPVVSQPTQHSPVVVQQSVPSMPRHVSCRTIGKTTHCF